MNTFTKKPIALAFGAAFSIGGMSAHAASQGSIFQATDLPSGYMMLAEGKCGEGKCGEGKCGTDKTDASAKAATDKVPVEGKCGEAMFNKLDKDGDGKLSKEEFMAGHKAHDAKAAEGKCGEGKCGGKK